MANKTFPTDYTAKTTPIGADLLPIADTEAGNATKKVTLANVRDNFLIDDTSTADDKLWSADKINTTKQNVDAGLTSIAGLTTAENKGIYTTALDTYATYDLTPFARTILDDADAGTVRTTI